MMHICASLQRASTLLLVRGRSGAFRNGSLAFGDFESGSHQEKMGKPPPKIHYHRVN